MPKLIEKIRAHQAAAGEETKDGEPTGKPFIAFEYYPPRTDDGVANLYKRLGRMAQQEPLYVDFTWGAGGSTADLTLELTVESKKRFGLEPNMHLTCTNMPVEKITTALEGAKAAGITNIVALRGDPPAGEAKWEAVEGGFACALDLVKYIKEKHGDFFGISVAGYPEGHPSVINKVEEGRALSDAEKGRVVTMEDGEYVCSDADFAAEIAYLKEKVDAGAELIITQMFFDVDVFVSFVAACRAAGIAVPILPGIMVIQAYGGFKRMTAFCKSRVPKEVHARLDAVKDDSEAVKRVGVEIGTEMSRALLAAGVPGLHFYCLNLEKVVVGIMENLGLAKPVDDAEGADE
uniref:Methylenetetrahydrofolate reductase (NAD(P)H) n=1 Tax=Bicosoecida sp. CB-2014 TaxID=1486930 RepID=A0A7S1C6C6_9STRA|mmetsp:Transcript_15474/g.53757  ORF Transcript_15474/g.53757 Transcript_15474/m.53757 type:complete len:348 (+) Transcript_15474:54-1097(+)|eukprot:CAMPEP_0203815348 /NCGR_PEP_ID=MMETSP0115-20131106/10344_1 /ASSEMBLY_ACC=CAM_ASM_000227 /TAXON_ID=33651 /ORGANISM="Bicosoecid sp, Strain ms1" /LENGTH=347 /DNA_ID=CAMNT_0050724245 /DNA_START=39 /DNA_END=1082 /DNA_ORIENTATION=+